MIYWRSLTVVVAGAVTSKLTDWKKFGDQTKLYIGNAFDSCDEKIYRIITRDNQTAKKKISPKTKKIWKIKETESNKRFFRSSCAMGIVLGTQVIGFTAMLPFNLFLIGFLAAPIFESAYFAIVKEKKLRASILDALVISLCIVFGQVVAAAFIVWIFGAVDLLSEKAVKKFRIYVTEILEQRSKFAWLLIDGVEVKVPVKELQKNDIIVVSAGDEIVISGVVVEGKAIIDQQSLTGEVAPVNKEKGDDVFATTILISGYLRIKVVKTW